MNKYAKVAIQAARLAAKGTLSPNEAWEQASRTVFSAGTDSQTKGCPRDTFHGLCQAELIIGVPGGEYTRSLKNRRYARDAVRLLRSNPSLASNAAILWGLVTEGVVTKHNNQMDVVIALWKDGYIKKPDDHGF